MHRIGCRVGSNEALEFWALRLTAAGLESAVEGDRLRFDDPEGLGFEFIAAPTEDAPLVARHPEIPERFALQGFAGVRAFERRRGASHQFLTETLGFEGTGPDAYESRGDSRGSFYVYDAAPEARGLGGSGARPHVAWSSAMEDHSARRMQVIARGGEPTPIIDRLYFRSIYFPEPSPGLVEVAAVWPRR